MTTALAFPGQGGDWNDAARILDQHADDPLTQAAADVVGSRDWATLDQTDPLVSQPIVYASSVLSAHDVAARQPIDAAIGHSLGELAAFVHAGALDSLAGLDLARRRAELCSRAQAQRPGAMVAVMRVDLATVEWCRRRVLASRPGVLEIGTFNGTAQFVLSGDAALAGPCMAMLEDAGAVVRRLPIAGASHSPLLADVADEIEPLIAACEPRDPQVPVISTTAIRTIERGDEVATALARSLVLPVRWLDAVRAARDLGVTELVDVGPGQTLARLANHDPILPVVAARDTEVQARHGAPDEGATS
jgi:[acyl-carrier-protein] S-malonyltransferase